MDQPLHPTPQFRRANWTDLSGTWAFAYDDADIGRFQGWQDRPECFDREIVVPFPPESPASGIGDTSFHPVVWYRRTFRRGDVAGADEAERLLLHFGAVDYRADVWINGQHVRSHEGGNTPFASDIARALLDGDETEQAIVVRAEDQPTDLTQPRGKQFWELEPRRIWYHRTTGIWQPVWLEPVAPIHIEEVRWLPDIDRGLVGMVLRLNRAPQQPLRLKAKLTLRGDLLAWDTYTVQGRETRREIGLDPAAQNVGRRRLLWSIHHPNLIDVELLLEDEEATVLDVVQSYMGLRSCGFSEGLFLLNGVPQYLRLVLSQGYWPESHLAAPSEDAIRREVQLIKDLGFNGVRIHQKVEDPRFLYWCDRVGLFVWGEMANAYAFNDEAVEKLTREWLEVVRRDYNHPSIVTWVPVNESWGVPNLPRDDAQRSYVRALYRITKAVDPTRPVIGNDGWEHFESDVWGIHDYALDGATIRERYETPEALERVLTRTQPHHHPVALTGGRREGQPVVLSEFGGISYAAKPGTPWFGYGTVDSPEAYLEKYREIVEAVLDCPTIAGFCYTQLTDTLQEQNGLVTEDRTPKLDVGVVSSINRRPSKAIPGDIVLAAQLAGEITSFGQAGG